jgi:catechol 2,3-dioxygenase-like lactoylglutathione lyase family enzyme
MKASEIDHLCVAVRDLDATMAVYEDILGLDCDGAYTAE